MFSIKPTTRRDSDEELGAVSIFSRLAIESKILVSVESNYPTRRRKYHRRSLAP